MDIAFVGDKFVVIYLDEITIFSKSDEDHFDHLKKTFEKCRKFWLSLNPKKSIFALEEGKLLGNIVSRDGVKIDPERVQVVQKIPLPRSKRDIQKFLGKINFLRRFMSNYVEIVKEITNMLKKENEVYWTKEARESFFRIKEALQSQIIAYVPNATVKDVLVQSDVEGKRGKWIAKIQEYDLDIKPTKLVKGQGLAKMLTESNVQAFGINLLTPLNEEVIEEGEEKSNPETIKDYHEKLCGGHYSWKDTTHKILQEGFYWPILFGDTYKFVKSYQKCQLFAEKKRLAPLPSILVFIEEPFRQWGLDFVGENNPPSSG
eukprot:PITA_29143